MKHAKPKRTFALIIFFVLLCVFLPAFVKFMELRQTGKELNEKIRNAKLRNFYLGKEKERLKKDDFYLEKVTRERLGVVKKGEVLYKIVPQETENSGRIKE